MSPTSDPPRWATWAVGLALIVLVLRVMGQVNMISLDLFHEIALIREALALGYLPREDLFAYTPSVSPSVHHEWATGAVLYLVAVGLDLGTSGLALLRAGLVAGTAGVCWAVARSRGAGGPELAITAPVAILLFWPGLSPVRAQMFTFLFLAVLLYFLERDRRGLRGWLVLWPLVFIAWLNMHGGFVVGAGMLGLYTLEQVFRLQRKGGWRRALADSRHLLVATGVTLPLTVVNPYGLDYLPYLWHALVLERPLIPEWAPLYAPEFRGAPLLLFGASLVVVLYTILKGKGWKQAPGLLLVLVAAGFAFRSVRILPIYAVTFVCYVPAALGATPAAELVRSGWRRYAGPIGATALVLTAAGAWNLGQSNPLAVELPTEPGAHLQAYPAGAVDYLAEARFQGNLMTPFGVGAFVSWYLYPDVKVGLDSRYEVAYPPEFVEEAIRSYQGRDDWREFLARYPTDAVLVATGAPLDSLLTVDEAEGRSPWVETYRDDAYAIFVRPEVAARLPSVDRRGRSIEARFP